MFYLMFSNDLLLISFLLIAVNDEVSSSVHPVLDDVEVSQGTSEQDVSNLPTEHGTKRARRCKKQKYTPQRLSKFYDIKLYI